MLRQTPLPPVVTGLPAVPPIAGSDKHTLEVLPLHAAVATPAATA
jgi:hypothetical protein